MKQPASSSLHLDDQLCFALYTASRAVTGAYRPVLAAHNLTYPQYLVLLALWESDGPSVTELGQRLMLDSGTLSPLLRRLEVSGRVERRRSASDGRLLTVHLTDEGHALRSVAREVQERLGGCIDLDEDEASRLRTLARRLFAPAETTRTGQPANAGTPTRKDA